jgi:Bacteriophage minor capsid protein
VSVANELVTYASGTAGLLAGSSLFYGEFKEAYPDFCGIIRETGGIAPEPNLGDLTNPGRLTRIQSPSLQIVVRGVRDDYDTPRTAAKALYDLFTAILNQVIGGVYYLSVDPIQEPFLLRTDDNFRSYIAFNIHVMKEPS